MLESYSHENNSFTTLTYDPENLTHINEKTGEICDLPTLVPSDLKKFMYRLRQQIKPKRIRFYGVGEYGDKSSRPHYHLALFGYEPCWHGSTRKDRHYQGKSCCPPCDTILKSWTNPKTKRPYGGIDNAYITPESAGYIAGYCTKKMTNTNDEHTEKLLKGRYPEFARMSNRPGIGGNSIDSIARTLEKQHGHYALTENGDVPISLNIGKRSFPLGRYLRQKLRDRLDIPETVKQESIKLYVQILKKRLKTLLKRRRNKKS